MGRPLLGLHLPSAGPLATRGLLLSAARLAEDAGFSSAWLLDRLLTPTALQSPYPYAPQGDYLFAPDEPFFDALASLAFLAGTTERITLGTAVLVPGYRHPITLARYAATLDELSGGRIVLGVGAGWMIEEFTAMSVDPSRRGSRLEELMDAMRTVWSDGVTSFEGEFYRWAEAGFHPRPHTGRSIPLLVGGHSERALERAARIGDGWVATLSGRTAPDLQGLEQSLSKLDRYTVEAGRDRSELHIHVFAPVVLKPWTRNTPRPLLRGEPGQVKDDLETLGGMGVDTVDCFVPARDGDEFLREAKRLADELIVG